MVSGVGHKRDFKEFLNNFAYSPSRRFFLAINLVNGISVNGLGEASMDLGGHPMMNAGGMMGTPPPTGNQPNIHPGCIPSTGRINSGGGVQQMPQNLAFNNNGQANGGNAGQNHFMGNNNNNNMTNGAGGGVMSNKYNSNQNNHQGHGSLQQQYMHHN